MTQAGETLPDPRPPPALIQGCLLARGRVDPSCTYSPRCITRPPTPLAAEFPGWSQVSPTTSDPPRLLGVRSPCTSQGQELSVGQSHLRHRGSVLGTGDTCRPPPGAEPLGTNAGSAPVPGTPGQPGGLGEGGQGTVSPSLLMVGSVIPPTQLCWRQGWAAETHP